MNENEEIVFGGEVLVAKSGLHSSRPATATQ